MFPRGFDRLMLELEWEAQPPLVTDIIRESCDAGGWDDGLRRAHLRLGKELQPLFACGWVLEDEPNEAVRWHVLTDARGRMLRTGCSVRLQRFPPDELTEKRAPERSVIPLELYPAPEAARVR
jgi:hypothetical protein